MTEVTILNRAVIEELLTIPMAVSAVEQAYTEKARGEATVWPMLFHEFEPGHADLDIKSGDLHGLGFYGLKAVSWFGANPQKDLPALYGTSLLFDLATGAPKALLNAGPITDLRTGAAGAIGAKYLARPDSKALLMAGSGALAPYLVAAALYLLPGLETVYIANPHHPEKSVSACACIAPLVETLLAGCGGGHARICAAPSLEAAARQSDIILTATPAYTPFLKAEWVKPGTHISCVGADMAGKQEIDSALFRTARVFADDTVQCLTVGECELPYKSGVFAQPDGEIGEVITGAKPGRQNDNEITIFDSTGIAPQDIAAAAALLKAANACGKGQTVLL